MRFACACVDTGYKTTILFFSLNVIFAMKEMKRRRFFTLCTWKFSTWERGYMTAHVANKCGYNWAVTMGLQLQWYVCWAEPSLNLLWLSQPYQPIPSIPMVMVGYQSNLHVHVSVTGNIDHKMPVIMALLHFAHIAYTKACTWTSVTP